MFKVSMCQFNWGRPPAIVIQPRALNELITHTWNKRVTRRIEGKKERESPVSYPNPLCLNIGATEGNIECRICRESKIRRSDGTREQLWGQCGHTGTIRTFSVSRGMNVQKQPKNRPKKNRKEPKARHTRKRRSETGRKRPRPHQIIPYRGLV